MIHINTIEPKGGWHRYYRNKAIVASIKDAALIASLITLFALYVMVGG